MTRVTPFAPRSVAILCQYGILGITPGVGPYTRRVVEAVRQSSAELVIIAGGGIVDGHGRNEAESVRSMIGAYASRRRVWLEAESTTTWGNLWYSIEMLEEMEFLPPEILVFCDTRRQLKVRLAIRLLQAKKPHLKDTTWKLIATPRHRVGWQDRAAVQLIVGSLQVLREALNT